MKTIFLIAAAACCALSLHAQNGAQDSCVSGGCANGPGMQYTTRALPLAGSFAGFYIGGFRNGRREGQGLLAAAERAAYTERFGAASEQVFSADTLSGQFREGEPVGIFVRRITYCRYDKGNREKLSAVGGERDVLVVYDCEDARSMDCIHVRQDGRIVPEYWRDGRIDAGRSQKNKNKALNRIAAQWLAGCQAEASRTKVYRDPVRR